MLTMRYKIYATYIDCVICTIVYTQFQLCAKETGLPAGYEICIQPKNPAENRLGLDHWFCCSSDYFP